MKLELVQAVLGNLRFNIFPLPLAVASMLLKHPEGRLEFTAVLKKNLIVQVPKVSSGTVCLLLSGSFEGIQFPNATTQIATPFCELCEYEAPSQV